MAERVKRAKLPFRLISPNLAKEEPTPEDESEEVKQIKIKIERLKEKNTKLSSNLQSLRHDYVDLARECEDKTRANEELMEKQRAKREYTFRIKQDLAAANAELTRRAQERNVASSSERQWKKLI